MAKKNRGESLLEDKRRALMRIGISAGVLVIFLVAYLVLLSIGFLDDGNISIMIGVSLVITVICVSVMGANFNSWSKANREMNELRQREARKKKHRS